MNSSKIPGIYGYVPDHELPVIPEMKTQVLHPDITSLSREEWLTLRRKGIGGSDIGAILGCGFKSVLDIWRDKTGRNAIEKGRPDNWFRLEFGNRIEPLMRDWYANVTGFNVIDDHRMFCKPFFDGGLAIADVDGLVEITRPDGSRETVILEIKTTDTNNINSKWCSGVVGGTGKLPPGYELQVRHYMMVTGINRAMVICNYGNDDSNIIVVQVQRDPVLEAVIYAEEKKFWEENVMKNIPPRVYQMATSAYEGLVKPSAPQKGKTATLASSETAYLNELLALDKQEDTVKAQLKDIEKRKNAVKAHFFDLMDGAESATLSTGNANFRFTLKNTQRRTVDSKKLKAAYPDVWEDVCKTSSSTSLKYEEIVEEKEVPA